MKLFLHIGTEKTGSSHLQSVLVKSRDFVKSYGFFFPYGFEQHEKRMSQGLVSAGNAFSLSKSMLLGDFEKVVFELEGYVQQARKYSASNVLLTSELLLPQSQKNKVWINLINSAKKAGFSEVEFCVVLRDPVDQVLSLYKHRAKSGKAGDISHWIKTGYHLPQDLNCFRKQVEKAGCRLVIRRYDRKPGWLDQVFFEDWLGIPTPQVKLPSSVNPSLSLSELVLIRQMAETRPALVVPLFDALSAVPTHEKVQGTDLEAYARAVAAKAVSAHADEWQAWNALLPEGEALTIPDEPEVLPPKPQELELSERQLQAVCQLLADATTQRFLCRLIWQSRLRPALGWVKRRLWR